MKTAPVLGRLLAPSAIGHWLDFRPSPTNFKIGNYLFPSTHIIFEGMTSLL